MGKRGTCPKCGTKLIVPTVERTTNEQPDPGYVPDEPASQPLDSIITDPAPSQGDRLPIDAFESVGPGPSQASLAAGRNRRSRRSRSTSLAAILIPSVCGTLLVSGVAIWLVKSDENHPGGHLTAFVVSPDQLQTGLVPRSAVSMGVEALDQVLSDIREPLQLRSDLMAVDIRGTSEGLEIRLAPGRRVRICEVQLPDDPRLADLIRRSLGELDRARQRELDAATAAFFDWLATDGCSELKGTQLSVLWNELALNSTRYGLGYVVEAVAGRQLCPCIQESKGRLYFPIPRGVNHFIIHGRTLSDGSKPFVGRYDVTIAARPTDDETPEPVVEPEPVLNSVPETDEAIPSDQPEAANAAGGGRDECVATARFAGQAAVPAVTYLANLALS